MKYIKSDGKPVPQGQCVVPDHWEYEFVVRVRTMSPISSDTVKRLIQTKHEVTLCERIDNNSTCVVR